jgi:fibronectin type 3 domain-containing protein
VTGQTTSFTLSGTPTKAVTDSFSVKVTGCGKISAQASYKVTIQSGANHVVNLDWNASTSKDVVGYNVYRSADASNWKKINLSLIGPTLYSDSTVSNSSTYYYSATAVDVNGKESVKTSAVKAVIP